MKKTDEEIRKEIQHIVFSWLNKAREQGRKQAREEILKKIDKFIIGSLYGDDNIDNKTYDYLVKKWKELKKEKGNGKKR